MERAGPLEVCVRKALPASGRTVNGSVCAGSLHMHVLVTLTRQSTGVCVHVSVCVCVYVCTGG